MVDPEGVAQRDAVDVGCRPAAHQLLEGGRLIGYSAESEQNDAPGAQQQKLPPSYLKLQNLPQVLPVRQHIPKLLIQASGLNLIIYAFAVKVKIQVIIFGLELDVDGIAGVELQFVADLGASEDEGVDLGVQVFGGGGGLAGGD